MKRFVLVTGSGKDWACMLQKNIWKSVISYMSWNILLQRSLPLCSILSRLHLPSNSVTSEKQMK